MVPEEPAAGAVTAHSWLLDVYPALRRADVVIRRYGSAEATRLEVAVEPTKITPGHAARTALATVDVYRNGAGQVEGLRANGVLVREAANVALRTQLDAHPAWTAGDIDAAITAAGGRFPSTARAACLTQTPALARILRREGTLVSAALVKTPDGPRWVCEVSTANRSYRLAFEPLGGQLVRMAVAQ